MAVTGARLAWCAETDRYAAGVLAHHWPGVPNLGDVTALDWARVPPVDLVSAGWPCQDISYAGPGPASRKGPAVDCGCTSPPAFATFDPVTSTWRTSPRSARAASRKSSATWPRSGMTRNGSAYALPTPEPRTAATASSSLPSGPAQPQGSRLLPTPVAGNYGDGASLPTWQARRDRQKKLGRNGNGIGTPLPVAIALLPTPLASDSAPEHVSRRDASLRGQTADRPARRDHPPPRQPGLPGRDRRNPARAGCCRPRTPAARRTATAGGAGRPGNGHQSGHGLDVAATALTPAPAQPAGARSRGESTSRRSAAGSTSSGTPRRRPPSRGRPAGPGCRPRSPSG